MPLTGSQGSEGFSRSGEDEPESETVTGLDSSEDKAAALLMLLD
jgi:hypothetical protein